MSSQVSDQPPLTPVLVTGMHRSGTTWLGEVLRVGGNFVNIGEPLNASNRQTILRSRTQRWYTYISTANESEYLPYYQDALAFKIHPLNDLRRMRIGSPRDPIRNVQRWVAFLTARLQHKRLLIKDPFAIFSAAWFAQRLGCRIVVIVRHPVAVVSSLKRLGYFFDFADLLQQPLLMADHLSQFKDDMEIVASRDATDVVGQGALLWKIIHTFIDEQKATGLFEIVRHEDLSIRPDTEFAELFEKLHEPLTDRARAIIEKSTSSGNPSELSRSRPFKTNVDSTANLGNWRHRLTADEVERVIDVTAGLLDRYYPEGRAVLRPQRH